MGYIGAPLTRREMKVFNRIGPLQAFLREQRLEGKSIGLVPTMGALHRGHTSLIEASRANSDLTICSLFINPTQFNDPLDLAKYPRDLASDKQLLTEAGCQVLFAPENSDMYGKPSQIHFDFGELDKVLEGKFRPGHFSGVALVVSKLFNIVSPDHAYFGCKDYQQFRIISVLTKELKFNLNLHCLPTIREEDGLALSSRNLRLNTDERKKASSLFRNLSAAREALLDGAPWPDIRSRAEENLRTIPGVKLEYFELADKTTLNPGKPGDMENGILLIAAFVGTVRLIDNLHIK